MEYDQYSLSGDVHIPVHVHENQMIKCIWYVKGYFYQIQHEQILPSGAAELIFNLSVPVSFQRNVDGATGTLPRCFINGINLNDVTLIKGEKQYLIGIQLYPYAIKALFNIPASEFTNKVTDLTLLDKELDILWHKLGSCNCFNDQVTLLLGWFNIQILKKNLHGNLHSVSHLYDSAHLNSKRVAQLADYYGFSERTLNRKCHEWLGVSTEAFLLYRKYLESLALLHHTDQSLTEIGHRSGYYDQSHFIREFRSFTSLTPGEYRKQKSIGMGHIFHFV